MTESSSDQIKHYAFLVTQSTNVDTDSLNHCLDDILNVLVDYLKIIEKGELEMNLFQSNLRPVIEEKQNQMNFLYEKIDNLELFLNCLKKSYSQLEKKLEETEKLYGKSSRLKRFIATTEMRIKGTDQLMSLSTDLKEENLLDPCAVLCERAFKN